MSDAPETQRSCCPITCALDVLGDRWTLVILRDLLLGRRESFSELASHEGIATNVLSDRLERLERWGIVIKERHPDDGRRRRYRPTERGWALTPILLDLLVWGADHAGGTAKPALVERARVDREKLLQELLPADD